VLKCACTAAAMELLGVVSLLGVGTSVWEGSPVVSSSSLEPAIPTGSAATGSALTWQHTHNARMHMHTCTRTLTLERKEGTGHAHSGAHHFRQLCARLACGPLLPPDGAHAQRCVKCRVAPVHKTAPVQNGAM